MLVLHENEVRHYISIDARIGEWKKKKKAGSSGVIVIGLLLGVCVYLTFAIIKWCVGYDDDRR